LVIITRKATNWWQSSCSRWLGRLTTEETRKTK